ncbi:uncharacterized protein LOC111639443 [Centruroides sculpturatus]|uniref:uncharacterized protein LOC111639443 n=1 Tax=Centruroides sculpturatus TaxID=218467 RepID=UPI000C6E0626|nr:uncharacterized protein LOC111639443 [Centruroides sculpturatus]
MKLVKFLLLCSFPIVWTEKSVDTRPVWKIAVSYRGVAMNLSCEEYYFSTKLQDSKIIYKALKFRCEKPTLPFPPAFFQSRFKENYDFQIFQVKAKFADVVTNTMPLSHKTFQQVDFSTVSNVEPIHFYMKRYKKKLTWQSVVNPFTKQVWLALIFTITVFGLIFRKFVKDNKGEPWTLRRTYWYLTTMLMYQGVDCNNVNRSSSRIAFGIWLLMTAVLIWGYAGILTSFMAVQTDEPVPNSFDELERAIKRREYTCVLLPHLYLSRFLNDITFMYGLPESVQGWDLTIIDDLMHELSPKTAFLFTTESHHCNVIELSQTHDNIR